MTIATGDAVAVRHGRPRDPHVDEAIQRAALELLLEEGFARMSIDAVACRAGVGKAAIYRRWDNKVALIIDAIERRVTCGMQWPSTGDIRADLEEIYSQMLRSVRGVEGELLAALVSEGVRSPELAAAFRNQFVAVRRTAMRNRLQAAMDEGQLPPGDVDLLVEAGFAIIHSRMLVSGAPLTDDLPRRIVEQFFPRA